MATDMTRKLNYHTLTDAELFDEISDIITYYSLDTLHKNFKDINISHNNCILSLGYVVFIRKYATNRNLALECLERSGTALRHPFNMAKTDGYPITHMNIITNIILSCDHIGIDNIIPALVDVADIYGFYKCYTDPTERGIISLSCYPAILMMFMRYRHMDEYPEIRLKITEIYKMLVSMGLDINFNIVGRDGITYSPLKIAFNKFKKYYGEPIETKLAMVTSHFMEMLLLMTPNIDFRQTVISFGDNNILHLLFRHSYFDNYDCVSNFILSDIFQQGKGHIKNALNMRNSIGQQPIDILATSYGPKHPATIAMMKTLEKWSTKTQTQSPTKKTLSSNTDIYIIGTLIIAVGVGYLGISTTAY